MPIYYFNIYNDDMTEDFEGIDLADDAAAHAYGIVAARSLAADTVSMGHIGLSHRIEIVNGDREPLSTVTFKEAVEVRA
jgi:hypothetical protein